MTIDELYREQAERRPDALAVVCGDEHLTFGALAARTRRLAARLQELGVAPERRVALVVERSLDVAIGTLAILEAGGAFVPIDPQTGAGRVRALASAAGAQLVVTRRALRQGAGDPGPVVMPAVMPAVMIDDDEHGGSAPPPAWSPPGGGRARLLYVMHTSGSTAAPRAVEVEHATAVDQVHSLAADLGIGPEDRHLHTASLGFTLAVRQLLVPICLGGAVVIARQDELRRPLALLGAAKRAGVTVLDLVPSLLRAVVGALRTLSPSERAAVVPDRLRLVLTAGEPLTAALATAWQELAGTGARLIHLYGASEVGGSVTWHEVGAADLGRASIPIGRARSGTTVELLDASLAPIPGGASGEVCVAGPAVARGYVRPGPADRARFVEAASSRVRWLRTGDLARRGDDGALEIVGRLDDEVKIRGVRVQPEAVEAVLGGAPGVTDVAVVSGGEPPRLIAYVVGAAPPADAAFRERVRAELPAAFVPAVFVRAAELPRLASGKVDRRALRERAAHAGGAGAPPATELELLVARHWRELLGSPPRGLDDDFFALGGSSLVALELSGRLGEALGVELPASLAFDRPTVGEQAGWLAGLEPAGLAGPAGIARPRLARLDRGAGGALALSFAQERLWLAEVLARGARGPRVHRGLRLTGPLDEARLEDAMCAVAARHEALRTTFASTAGQPYQIVHAALPRDHEAIDLTASSDDARAAELARRQVEERGHAFDLERGPLWRTRLLRLGPQAHVLLLTIHHLVTDGWSMRRWLGEVEAHYAAPPGAAPAVPDLVVQPADVAAWQRRCIARGAYDAAAAYWRARLAGVGARPELPHDGPRQDRGGAWVEAALGGARTAALHELACAEGSTLFTVLLAALAQLVAELTGEDEVTLGTLVAGRDRPELRPLIGLFLNTLPLRVRTDRAAGFHAVLASARDVTRGALAHAELPFERIVADLNPPRQLRRNPIFDVALNYLPPGTARQLGDLAVDTLEPGPDVDAPFDVMWRVVERDRVLRIRVEYRRGRFAPERIRAWLDRYLDLLARGAGGA